jgi:hypothetical protein
MAIAVRRFRHGELAFNRGLLEFESMELHMTLMKSGVARAFEVDHCAVERALQRGYEDLPARGRHRELSVDSKPS